MSNVNLIPEDVWKEFFPRLMRFALGRMTGFRSGAFDEEDIALSALNSFFRGCEQGEFEQLGGQDELWRLLATIAARKLIARQRRATAEKRDERRNVCSIDAAIDNSEFVEGVSQLVDHCRLPESTELIFSACEELLAMLSEQKLRDTAVLRMEGYTNREISERLNCSLARTKQRIAKIKLIWLRHFDADA